MKEEEIKKSGPEDCFFSLPAQLNNVIYLNFLKDEKHHAWTKKVTPKVMVLKSLKHHISKRNISAFGPLIRHFDQLKQSCGEKSIKDQQK